MKSLINILFFATVLLLTSCAQESLDSQPALGPNDVQIKLLMDKTTQVHSRANEIGTPLENRIHSVQLLVFSNENLAPTHTFYLTTQTPTASSNQVVWDPNKETIVIRDLMTATSSYTIYAIVNSSAITTPISKVSDLERLVSTSVQPVAAPTEAHGLSMSGVVRNYKFADHNNTMSIDLTRQVAKVRLTLKLDKTFTDKYPLMTFGVDPVRIRTLNVPNMTNLVGPPAAVPPSATIADLSPIAMSKTGQGWITQMYLYENMAPTRAQATRFIIGLPYSDGTKTTTDNYYLVELNAPYQTQRNCLYDVTVTVKGFGDRTPTIDGVTVTTNVLKWNGIEQAVDPSQVDLLSLSNTECQIYGDKGVDVLVGQVSLRRADLTGQLSVAKQGDGFEIIAPTAPVDMTFNTTVDIRVRVTDNHQTGSVVLHFGNTTQTIAISTAFDHHQLLMSNSDQAYSDVPWCTLSTAQLYQLKDQKQALLSKDDKKIYLNISKATLGDTPRTGTIMLTKTDASVTRVVVVQQPYIAAAEVIGGGSPAAAAKWATGNIGLGYRPDGEMCYVIDGAHDYGLCFNQNALRGFNHTLTAWSTSHYYYTPSGSGASLLTQRSAGLEWDKVKALASMPGDPCSMVYSASGVHWRTPTVAELHNLVNQKGGNGTVVADHGWSNAGHLGQGFNSVDGKLFLPTTGLFFKTGSFVNLDQEGKKDVGVRVWASELNLGLAVTPKYDAFPDGICYVGMFNDQVFAMAVRCVRAN